MSFSGISYNQFWKTNHKQWNLWHWNFGDFLVLGIITRRNQEVGEHSQLIVGKLLFVILPVVLMRPFEVLQSLLNRHLKSESIIVSGVETKKYSMN